LQGDDGKEITLPEFNELLLHRENAALLVLAIQAAQIVGVDTQTVQAEAEKNSETPSTGS